MKKVKLTLNEILILDRELNGVIDNNGKILVKGFLSHKMGIVSKYRLSKVSQALAEEKKLFNEVRNELLKNYADDAKGKELTISKTFKKGDKEVENPNYDKFIAEITKLGLEEKEIEFKELNIEDFQFETEEYYNILFEKIL